MQDLSEEPLNWDIKVPIKESYLKCLPFSFLQSRYVVSEIFSFLSYGAEVIHII